MNTVRWEGGQLTIIDQTALPADLIEIPLDTVDAVFEAIKMLRVRGAPAIGVCAGYGLLVGLHTDPPASREVLDAEIARRAKFLGSARPTAVNLTWALSRIQERLDTIPESETIPSVLDALLDEARAIHREDEQLCRRIGEHGHALILEGTGVLTHCNAGALATAGIGTALAPLYVAKDLGRSFSVFADETRPLLQGSRLTAWELSQAGIDVTVICDNMAAQVMREGRVQLVITGADRIAANGDVANKIGTYGVALLARAHGIPFYVAAPSSTFDLTAATGADIPIEERAAEEIGMGFGQRTAPENVAAYNPAFDVTDHALIHGIITEHGILRAPYAESIAVTMRAARTTIS